MAGGGPAGRTRMSYLVTVPELVSAAAADLTGIGETLSEASASAAAPTTVLLAAGADEVSGAIAALFSGHGQAFQAVSTQAAAFHDRFVQLLSSGAGAYTSAEAANVAPLQSVEQNLLGMINAPTKLLLDRPLIGNGADAAAGSGLAGEDGGLLLGNGGKGGSGAAGQA